MKPIRLVFIGVGGQGNLLASRLLGEAALSLGIPAVVSEIHGMAQRGGIVESAVLMGEVTSPIVSNGEADVLIGFESMETLRALDKCNTTTLIITNTIGHAERGALVGPRSPRTEITILRDYTCADQ